MQDGQSVRCEFIAAGKSVPSSHVRTLLPIAVSVKLTQSEGKKSARSNDQLDSLNVIR